MNVIMNKCARSELPHSWEAMWRKNLGKIRGREINSYAETIFQATVKKYCRTGQNSWKYNIFMWWMWLQDITQRRSRRGLTLWLTPGENTETSLHAIHVSTLQLADWDWLIIQRHTCISILRIYKRTCTDIWLHWSTLTICETLAHCTVHQES